MVGGAYGSWGNQTTKLLLSALESSENISKDADNTHMCAFTEATKKNFKILTSSLRVWHQQWVWYTPKKRKATRSPGHFVFKQNVTSQSSFMFSHHQLKIWELIQQVKKGYGDLQAPIAQWVQYLGGTRHWESDSPFHIPGKEVACLAFGKLHSLDYPQKKIWGKHNINQFFIR